MNSSSRTEVGGASGVSSPTSSSLPPDGGHHRQSDTSPNLLFCAICRLEDRCVLARYMAPRAGAVLAEAGTTPVALTDTLQRVLHSKKVAEHRRLTIEERQLGLIHYENDGKLMYVVFARADYSQRLAFQFLHELRNEFVRTMGTRGEDVHATRENALTRDCRAMISELMALYDRPAAVDKVARVRMQVDEVKGQMHDNVQQVMKNTDDLQQLQTQSEDLRGEASAFHRTAGVVERKYWWRNTRMILIIVAIVIAILAAIIIPIAITKH
ncbi:hypothetical protein CDCA_CDCA18G4567 [Cyanidium caldarium]|uniref:Uncharacterized protein n=1 Tax=Cyanidium caldarium TaxID=2771 RepID=A0AAV9J1T0_CYACA|nr:hypothetical protein CDCA_CDCA18G4567 [Cyanidium caldarium]